MHFCEDISMVTEQWKVLWTESHNKNVQDPTLNSQVTLRVLVQPSEPQLTHLENGTTILIEHIEQGWDLWFPPGFFLFFFLSDLCLYVPVVILRHSVTVFNNDDYIPYVCPVMYRRAVWWWISTQFMMHLYFWSPSLYHINHFFGIAFALCF